MIHLVIRSDGTSPPWLQRAGLVVSSIMAALLLSEIATRVVYHKELDPQTLRAQLAATFLAPFTRPSADPRLVYELRPGADVVGNGSRMLVGTNGCRVVPDRTAPSPRGGSLRIAILGDSTSFGWGVPFEESYGEVLRDLLERSTGKTLDLRNYSVPGYNSFQNRVTLETKVLPWKPNLIILHYDHNDSDIIADKPPDYLDPTYGDNAAHSMLIKFLRRRLRRWENLHQTVPLKEAPGDPERFILGFRYAGPQFRRHMDEMRRIKEEAEVAGIPIVVFIFNPWLKRFSDPLEDPFFVLLHRPVSEILHGYGYDLVDCYPFFQDFMRESSAADLRALWRSQDPLDGHPNSSGHRLIAELLQRRVSLYIGRP